MLETNDNTQPIGRIILPQKIGPYRFQEQIGAGSTSEVYKVINDGLEGVFCCKVVSKKKFVDQLSIEHFRSELVTLEQTNHPNIVGLIDLFQDSLNFYIITEYCEGGSLDKFIISQGKIEEGLARKVFLQVLEGLNHLHTKGISHRDIKAENVFICDNFTIKLGDFGFASGRDDLLKTYCGTLTYCSPEVMNRIPYDGKKADMWSCGILLYTMVTGRFPWTVRNQAAICEQVKSGYIGTPSGVSTECIELIHMLTQLSPDNRPTCSEAIRHKWLHNIQKPLLPIANHQSNSSHKLDEIFEQKNGWRIKIPTIPKQPFLKAENDVQLLLKVCSRFPKRRKSESRTLLNPISSSNNDTFPDATKRAFTFI